MLSFLIPVGQLFQLVTAAVASVVFLVFAVITFGASFVGLTVATPLFVIFSPILVPATIATSLSAGAAAVGLTALALVLWLIKSRIGVKTKNNPVPAGAPTKADEPGGAAGDKPAGDKPAGDKAGDKAGAKPGGDKPAGDKSGDKAGSKPGGEKSGDKAGAKPGGDKPEDKPPAWW